MRLFTTEVLNQTVQGTTPIITSSELRDVLGRADVLIVEIEITKSTASVPVTIKLQHSNSGRQFADRATLYNQTISAPAFVMVEVGTEPDPLGALVQLQVQLGGANDEIALRIVVTGRSW